MYYNVNVPKLGMPVVSKTNNNNVNFKGRPIKVTSVDVEKGISALLALASINAAAVAARIGMRKDEITPEQTKALQENAFISIRKSNLAKMLQIDPHGIDWHIKKGHLEPDERGNIDLTNPVNIEFCKNFNKGTRRPKEVHVPTSEEILSTVPQEYFVVHKMLVTDKNGNVDLNNEQNKQFLEKWKNKEISINDFRMTTQGFAEKTGRQVLTINRAIAKGELVKDKDGKIDILRPENASYIKLCEERKDRPKTMLTTKELGQLLGYKSGVSAVQYHIRFKDLVREPNGLYDITKEPNATFIKRRLNGEEQILDRGGQTNGASVRRMQKHSYTTQGDIAKMKGITTATVGHHISVGHLVVDKESDHIDLNNPVNAYFINNFKKGEMFIPYGQTTVKSVGKTEEPPKTIHVNPKELSKKSLALVTGITPTPVSFNTEKGRLVLNENKKYDISNPVNAEFISTYSRRMAEKIRTATPEQLNELEEKLKQYIQPYFSREKYIVVKQILDDSPEVLPTKYVRYSVDKIIDTENLSDNQKQTLYDIVTEMIIDKINEPDAAYEKIPIFQLNEKCKLFAFEELLNRV